MSSTVINCVQEFKTGVGGPLHTIFPLDRRSPLYHIDFYNEKTNLRENIAKFHIFNPEEVQRIIPCEGKCMFVILKQSLEVSGKKKKDKDAVVKKSWMMELWTYSHPRKHDRDENGMEDPDPDMMDEIEEEDDDTKLPYVRISRLKKQMEITSTQISTMLMNDKNNNKIRMKLNQTENALLFYDDKDFFVVSIHEEKMIFVENSLHLDLYWADDDTIGMIGEQNMEDQLHRRCICFMYYSASQGYMLPLKYPKIENLPDQVHVIGNDCVVFDACGGVYLVKLDGTLERLTTLEMYSHDSSVMTKQVWDPSNKIVAVIYLSKDCLKFIYKRKGMNQYIYKSVMLVDEKDDHKITDAVEIRLKYIVHQKHTLENVTFLQFSRVPMVMATDEKNKKTFWYSSTQPSQRQRDLREQKDGDYKLVTHDLYPWVQLRSLS